MTPEAAPGADRAAALFLLALAVYFAAQVALRVALGGSLEADEAEMVVLARDWQLAAGSQPPLYNWYQTLFFGLFGVTTLGVVLAKNLMLFGTYAMMFLALRPGAGVRLAMVGSLGLALIPNLAWWAQRTGSHSIALAFTSAATVAAVLHLLRRPGTGAFLLFGVVVGLGGLAKPNYWLLPPALLLSGLSLPGYRAILWDRRLGLAAAAALAVLALPYGAMLAAPEATFSDVWEFRKGAEDAARLAWVGGLRHVLGAGFLELTPVLLAAALVLGLGGPAVRRPARPAPEEILLLRAALIGLLLLAVGVVLFDVAFFRARWMLPLFILGVPPLVMVLFRAASARTTRVYLWAMAGLALLLLAGIADVRLRGAGSDSLRVEVLAEEIERQTGEVPPMIGPHYFTGNLLLHRPDWEVFPPFPTRRLDTPSGRLLVIETQERPGEALRRMREHGFSGAEAPAPVLRGAAVLPYRFTERDSLTVRFSVYDFGPPRG